MTMICVTSVLRNAILYSMCIPSSYSLAKCMWLYNIYIYMYICLYLFKAAEDFSNHISEQFALIFFDLVWCSCGAACTYFELKKKFKTIVMHAETHKHVNVSWCFDYVCGANLNWLYTYIYICFVRWYVLHILSAVQIEFAGSRVGEKEKNWSNSGKKISPYSICGLPSVYIHI